jgi:hypothetical protein
LLDKTKLDQLDSSYQELQQKYALLEQIKSEYDSFKENTDTTNTQLKQQLEDEREKINELQNIISQATIGLFTFHIILKFLSFLWSDKTRFDELDSSYQELEKKYRAAEQIKSEYESFKENADSTNLELKQQLADEREKLNELQNIIDQGTISLCFSMTFINFLFSFSAR